MIRQFFAFSLTFVALANSASAHPGHGNANAQDGVMHYLTSPMHLGSGLLLVLGVAALVRIAFKASDRSNNQR